MGFKTFVAGDVLTAAQVNDYLMEQAVIACTSGTRPSSPNEGMTIYQTDTDTYAVYGTAWCEITPKTAKVATLETTTSTSFTDLATAGPAVTVQTSTNALVSFTCDARNTTAGQGVSGSFAVSGATTVAASDANGRAVTAPGPGYQFPIVFVTLLSSLTAGSNVFTSKYLSGAFTSTFLNRSLSVMGVPA